MIARRSLIPPAAPSAMEGAARRASGAARRDSLLLPDDDLRRRRWAARTRSRRSTRLRVADAARRHDVPLLYMRTTKGQAGDWEFDPEFDLGAQMRRPADPRGQARTACSATRSRTASGEHHPERRHLGRRLLRDAGVGPDRPPRAGSRQLPVGRRTTRSSRQLRERPAPARGIPALQSLTYNVYATQRARLQAPEPAGRGERLVATFARVYPELFVGVTLDADTYMNPFLGGGYRFDYNPGMLRQFREWLRGERALCGQAARGVPDLSLVRRARPLTLEQVNRLAGRQWKSWDEVEPPRELPGVEGEPDPEGGTPFWQDTWYLEWDAFRKHVVAPALRRAAHVGARDRHPGDRIFTAQAFTAPDPGLRPVSLRIRSPAELRLGGRVDRRLGPARGHLGTIMYGLAAQDRHGMDNGRGVYSNIRAHRRGLGASSSTTPPTSRCRSGKPDYEWSYRTFREHVQLRRAPDRGDGLERLERPVRGHPDYLPYTAFRNTRVRERDEGRDDRPRRSSARRAPVDVRVGPAGRRRRAGPPRKAGSWKRTGISTVSRQWDRRTGLAARSGDPAEPARSRIVRACSGRQAASGWRCMRADRRRTVAEHRRFERQRARRLAAGRRSGPSKIVGRRSRSCSTHAPSVSSAQVHRVPLYPRGTRRDCRAGR